MKSAVLSLATVATLSLAGFAATAHAAGGMTCCDSSMKEKCGAMMKGMHGDKAPQTSSTERLTQPSVGDATNWGG